MYNIYIYMYIYIMYICMTLGEAVTVKIGTDMDHAEKVPFITLDPRGECHNSLWALKTSPPPIKVPPAIERMWRI